ncbi:MAG: hypothetical protein R3C49_14985 [Planctomycetaceae bacterium]
METVRICVDQEARSGQDNMARDEAMLEQAAAGCLETHLRLYSWSEPTVSLGYFQKEQTSLDPRLQHCAVVRRITGGGAILHHHELTYSCALPAAHPAKHNPLSVYDVVHKAIIDVLRACGVSSCLRRDSLQARQTAEDVFLCFLRADPRDIVIGYDKIVGSAQRRRKGSILQHGSILLKASELTPEVPGIHDLCSQFDEASFRQLLPEALRKALQHDAIE